MASCKVNSILLLFVVVVRMSCCNAQKNNSALELLDFTVTKAEPVPYRVGKPTTVTFSVDLTNAGITDLNHTSGTVCVIFFDISTDTDIIRNVGQVNLTLPDFRAGQTHHLERETVDITLKGDACTDGRKLCAGIKIDRSTSGELKCVNFNDIDEGGAGEIDCSKVPVAVPATPAYVIALPVVLSLLLVAVVVFLLLRRKCHREPTDVQSSRMADLRQRFRSLPHIYDNPSTLTGESNYDSTIPKNPGSPNAAFEVENETENPYSTNLPGAGAGSETLSPAYLMRKRPSQANEYTLEESPFCADPTMAEDSPDAVQTVHLEGVTEDESATDRKSVAFSGFVEKSHQTAVDATPRSVEMLQSAEFPQRAAPEAELDLEPAQVPNLEQFPSRPCPVIDTNDTTRLTDNHNLVSGVGPTFEHNQNPDLNQEPDSFPVSQENCSALKKTTPVPAPRKISISGNNPDVQCEANLTKIEETTDYYCDDPYLPPKPRVRIYSPQPTNNEQQAVPRKPPIAKPRPPSLHKDQDTTTPPRPPRPPHRMEDQTTNISDSRPKLKQKSKSLIKPDLASKPARPARKSKSDVDHAVLKDAIVDVVRKIRSPGEVKDPFTVLAEDKETNAIIPDPNDSDFLDAVVQNYLSLIYEVSRGEEEYETTINRDLERIDSNTLNVEPQLEYRRKSVSAQLSLTLTRKKNRDSEIYVNQWNKSWEFKRYNLEVDMTKPLGEGQFGKVYKGKATMFKGEPCDMDVAVKVLKDDAGNDAKDEFLKELAIHTILKPNPHVVQLIGCCIRDDPICIITEFLSGGNLLQYLRGRPSHLTGRASVQHYIAKFGLQIARGMEYVSKMKIVHRDLAARNILISEYEVCKVADFGFARDIFGLAFYPKSPERAPIRWYAPEAILDDIFSTKSDVWSFGILLFEIATLGKVAPYRGMDNNQVRFSVSNASHPKRPTNCDDILFQIMKSCWAKDPEKRPTFHELVLMFEGIQDNYPEPNQADPRPIDPNLDERANPESHQNASRDPHPGFSPNPQTVEPNPDIPPRVNNNPIPQIRVDPESEFDPDPCLEVNSCPDPEVISEPYSKVNFDPPAEVNPDANSELNTDPDTDPEFNPDPDSDPELSPVTDSDPELNLDPDSELSSDPDSDPEVDPDPLPEVIADYVSPAEGETDEEESF